MPPVDVTVFGAGVFGLSIAYVCARRGARVRVVDPGGVAAGSSGGIVGALAPHVPENWNAKKAFQFESLIAARQFWADVARIGGGDPGYLRSGRLQPIADDDALARARSRAEQARDLWQGAADWRVVRADAAGAFAPISPTGWLVLDTLTARLHPRRACQALAASIAALGGTVSDMTGESAGRVILATGAAGLADLSSELGRTVGTGIKGQSVLLDHPEPDAPQLFADGLHIVPHADGTVAIGSTTEREFDDPTATDAQADALVTRARAICPALRDAPVLARWAGLRPRSRSRAPMLGAHPARDGVFIANGGFKIGFGMAPKMAAVMADLVLDGHDAIPPGFRVQDNL